MRESYQKLRTACLTGGNRAMTWLSTIESTGWIAHLHRIVSTSTYIVEHVQVETEALKERRI